MKWGIFGKKKLNKKIDTLQNRLNDLAINMSDLNLKLTKLKKTELSNIANNQSDLAGKFDRLIDELKKLQEMAKIPVVKPFIRDPEKTYNEERKKDEENYAHNLWRI